MTACRRFDDEAMPRLVAGQALADPHFDRCPDCLAARASHDRLLAELAATNRLAPGERPRADWRERVLEQIDRRSPDGARRRFRAGWGAVAGLVAGFAAVFLLLPNRLAPPGVASHGLSQQIVAGAATSRGRGDVARPGDRLELVAETGDAAYAELRLYWNRDRLVLRCSGDTPPCRRRGGRLEADLALDARGSYLPLLLLAATPVPSPGSNFDADTAAAIAAGVRVEPGREVSVR